MKKFNICKSVAAGLIMISGAASAEAPESDREIKIALNNWSSQNVSSYVLGTILDSKGYRVEYIQADAMAQFAGLETGDITMQTEIWPTTQGKRFAAGIESGGIVDLGGLGLMAIEEWWYPTYMKEFCPGLPNWEALKDPACAEAFSSPQTTPNGRYLGAPANWEGFDDERVESLGLPFTVIHAGTDAAMFAELDSAYQRKGPIIMWVYSPHWAPAKYEGEWVEFPEHTPECYTDPKWGSNPEKAYDCGKPHGEIYKFAWAGMKDKWPVAYKVAKAYQIDTAELNKMSGEIDLDGKSPDDVAKAWLDANEAKWKAWAQ